LFLILAAVSICGTVPASTVASGQLAGTVAIFYYPWYGTPVRDGAWQHWDQRSHLPPIGIASRWYPARGAYSSSDPTIVAAHMQEIAAAGIDTVIVSWWGPGSVEDVRLARVLTAIRAAGMWPALHIEPYAGRTPRALAADVHRFSALGIRDFYVYDSTASPDVDWAEINLTLPHGARLFANTGLPGKALAGGFAGLYTYDVFIYDGSSFRRMCASARTLRLACAPSVGPGYDARRATGDPRVRPRRDGRRYDHMWRSAVGAGADIVTITSYNEWHEGTQIEPAQSVGRPYGSYEHAWGRTGPRAENAYLERTAYWASRYRIGVAARALRQTQ
jgi:hypothetical protein